MTSYTNVFGDNLILPANNSYLAIALNADTQLAWSSQFGNTALVFSSLMNVTPNANNHKLIFPDATLTSVGMGCSIYNTSTYSFNIYGFGGTLITAVAAGNFVIMYLEDVSTTDGQWNAVFNLATGGVSSITVNTTPTSGNLVVSPTTPITTAGTFTFSLGGDLLGLTSLGSKTGLAVRTAVDVWDTRALTGSTDIIIDHSDGVAANPAFSLAPHLGTADNIQSIIIGNLAIANNSSLDFSNEPQLSPLGIAKNIVLASIPEGGVFIGLPPTLIPFGSPLYAPTTSLVFPAGGTASGYTSFSLNPTNGSTINQYILPTTPPSTGNVLGVVGPVVPITGGGTAQLGWISVLNRGIPILQFLTTTPNPVITAQTIGISPTPLTDMTITITPATATSKIFIFAVIQMQFVTNPGFVELLRNGVGICRGNGGSLENVTASNSDGTATSPISIMFLDSPGVTTATTYTFNAWSDAATCHFNSDAAGQWATASTFYAVELGF